MFDPTGLIQSWQKQEIQTPFLNFPPRSRYGNRQSVRGRKVQALIRMKIQFYLRFHTGFGQALFLESNTPLSKDNPPILALKYVNEEYWMAEVEIELKSKEPFVYNYFLSDKDGEIVREWGKDRMLETPKASLSGYVVIDTWNHAGEY